MPPDRAGERRDVFIEIVTLGPYAKVTAIDSAHRDAGATSCVRCHAGAGHGDSVMSAAPQAAIENKRVQP